MVHSLQKTKKPMLAKSIFSIIVLRETLLPPILAPVRIVEPLLRLMLIGVKFLFCSDSMDITSGFTASLITIEKSFDIDGLTELYFMASFAFAIRKSN